MGMNWCEDQLLDVTLIIQSADKLWERQCFKDADPQITRRIIRHLEHAKAELEEILAAIEVWGT